MSEELFNVESRRKAKLNAIVTTAAKLIYKKSIVKTSLDDVADELGVTKPTLYHYVQDKEELIYLCLCRILDQKKRIIKDANLNGKNGLEKLEIFITEYANLVWNPESGLPHLMMGSSISPERTKSFTTDNMKLVKATRGFIEEGIKDKSIKNVDPDLLENYIISFILWGPISFRHRKEKREPEEIIRNYLKFLTEGISTPD